MILLRQVYEYTIALIAPMPGIRYFEVYPIIYLVPGTWYQVPGTKQYSVEPTINTVPQHYNGTRIAV